MRGPIGRHETIALDSNVLIYLIDGSDYLADKASQLIDQIEAGGTRAVISSLGLAEICAGPARAGDHGLVERFADEIHAIENLRVVALDAETAVDAATLRGRSQMSLADAIHLATARSAGATLFVTNDRRIRSVPNLRVSYLDELNP